MAKYKIKENEDFNVLNEPPAAYENYNLPVFSKSILYNTGDKVPEYKLASFEKMAILHSGLKKTNLENLKSRAELDYDKLSIALSVTRATLINKKGNETYSDTVSERILALSDLYSYGYKVFEDEAKFNDWMFRANKALAGKTPYDIVDNQFGREEIKNLIGRIEYGVYS
ncbi:antitoxin Xre/MbcA/ParS toxin-binding domain-containing protein [Flavobacterium sp.]|uniref:antitoxin Xre/MbcA/ParS toxin-binding domain-containing protein n=1 Tax=Flavobacterium sp. TaxID=239 RepID=UPI003752D876